MSAKKDMLGKQFGDWYVLEEDKEKNRHYICECTQCGKIKSVHGYSLRSGKSTSCGCVNGVGLKDETGNKYGMLTVQKYLGNKRWQCICECGKIVVAYGKDLRNGDTTSCGGHRYIDLKGQTFGAWKVISYAGDNYWNCKCECGTEKIVLGQNLRNGRSSSCGCKSGKNRAQAFKNTMKIKYGEVSTKRINNPRQDWQIDTVDSRDKFIQYIDYLTSVYNRRPTIEELANGLDMSYRALHSRITQYGVQNMIMYLEGSSKEEEELANYIKSIYSGELILHSRKEITPYELDIYIPGKKIAFEFNGNYWHCDDVLDKHYHQDKTLQCEKLGIRLIHIFEYEWLDITKKDKIKQYIYDVLNNNSIKINARQCDIVVPNKTEVQNFLNQYHLQGSVAYTIAYGIQYNNELLGLMVLGKPRFNSSFQWEIIRLSFKSNIVIIGGASKLLEHFKRKHNPVSIISYCDKSKFTGNVYIKLGFQKLNTTEPNYVWVNYKNDVLPRYRTTKQNLLEHGIGDESMSETEIMKCLHYMRVHDCGNDVYVWHL